MNKLVQRMNRYQSLLRVLDQYADALSGKTEIIAAKDSFSETLEQLESVVSDLVYPLAFIKGPVKEQRLRLRSSFQRISRLGILIAKKHKDPVMLSQMKTYRSMVYNISSYRMAENSRDLADVIESYLEDGETIGFTATDIANFRQDAEDFSGTMRSTRAQLEDRRKMRTDVEVMFKACASIITEIIDPFVQFSAPAYPDFATAYKLIRYNSGKGKTTGSTISETAEISGTVADAATNLPIEGATVFVTAYNLLADTDADGCYVFEGLAPGEYRVGCTADGYITPAVTVVSVAAGDSADADIFLAALPASGT